MSDIESLTFFVRPTLQGVLGRPLPTPDKTAPHRRPIAEAYGGSLAGTNAFEEQLTSAQALPTALFRDVLKAHSPGAGHEFNLMKLLMSSVAGLERIEG